ncbi:hypothetical protein HP550_17635 [Cellulomonas humilata]|uniref:Uncharacterized protein n=1 Tax=Cellulomonas humilata TaxID=144055 RepID=A0A7Y6DYX3_9CELL|nr:hypothetical protein [Cellulomonas humilata]NUU19073.1 hypothetical protein [Cellulomonas humilata]
MVFEHQVSAEIRFLTDGRMYEPVGRRAGDFIAVFGELQSGPHRRPGAVHMFHARCLRPDGDEVIAEANLDHPADPELIDETEFMVLLFALERGDVPPGTLITSLGRVMER